MPADLINLRQARKARARLEKEAQAAENRARFGRSKAERQAQSASEDLDRRRLAAHQLEPKPKSE
jgi:hypothetical protein